MKTWGECYYDHFERFMGPPAWCREYQMDQRTPSIQMLAYDGVLANCRVFGSLGLTHYAGRVGRVAEVIVPTDDGWQTVPYVVANCLFYMVREPMEIGWGLAVSGIEAVDPGFVRAYGKVDLYVTNPFGLPDEFSRVECGGEAGRVYLGFFITEAERRYFAEHGASAFEDLLQSKEVDVYALARPSCV